MIKNVSSVREVCEGFSLVQWNCLQFIPSRIEASKMKVEEKHSLECPERTMKGNASERIAMWKSGENGVETKEIRKPSTQLRAVSKNGDCNIFPTKIPRKRFVRDIFTTLVDLQWRWILAILTAGFFASWFIFGVGWWLVAYLHGDLEEKHLPMHQKSSNFTPCVKEIYGLMSCFIFSVETQHTTGYGERTPTEECFEGILLMCIQNIIGLIIEAFLVGIVFAKITRPKLRTQTLRFSKSAVICQRDGVLCLMFRIGDMRTKSRIIEAKIKAQLIRPKRTKEGETLNSFQTRLSVSADECEGDLFFIWPMSVIHKMDKRSPLYHLSSQDLQREKFEIVVTLEGTIESTDQKTQARSSYLSSEVIWGHRFESVVVQDEGRGGYKIDYMAFDKIVAVDTPLSSASELDRLHPFNGSISTRINKFK